MTFIKQNLRDASLEATCLNFMVSLIKETACRPASNNLTRPLPLPMSPLTSPPGCDVPCPSTPNPGRLNEASRHEGEERQGRKWGPRGREGGREGGMEGKWNEGGSKEACACLHHVRSA